MDQCTSTALNGHNPESLTPERIWRKVNVNHLRQTQTESTKIEDWFRLFFFFFEREGRVYFRNIRDYSVYSEPLTNWLNGVGHRHGIQILKILPIPVWLCKEDQTIHYQKTRVSHIAHTRFLTFNLAYALRSIFCIVKRKY